MILDRYDDNDLFLRKVFAKGIPAIVKTASHAANDVFKFAEDYALVMGDNLGRQYKYSISDAGNTIMSALYFSEYGEQLSEGDQVKVAQKLNDALVSYGFTPPTEFTKTAAMELGFSYEADEMSLESLFGVGEDPNFEIIEGAFDELSPRGKRRLALQVKEAQVNAPEALADCDPRLDKYAGLALGSDLELALDARKLCIVEDEKKNQLDQILVKSSSVSPENLVKDLQDFDHKNKLIHLYDRLIPDPYTSVYGGSIEKSASSVEDTVHLNDSDVPESEFTEMINSSAESLEERFGADLVTQLKIEPVTVFNSLPDPFKKALGGFFNDRD